LSEKFGVTPILIDEIVAEMLKAKLLVETNAENSGLVPGRDMQSIYIADILAAIDGKQTLSLPSSSEILATANIMDKLSKARMSVVGEQTLQDLVAELNNHN
jgi:DNA-binding IscR family transcriptional regulator